MNIKAYKQIIDTGELIETAPNPPPGCKVKDYSYRFSNSLDIPDKMNEQYNSKGVLWRIDNLVLSKIINIVNEIDVSKGQVLKFHLSTCGNCPKQKIEINFTFRKDLDREFCSNTLNKLYNGDVYVYIKEKNKHYYCLDYEFN
jgi:hypothetical protein